MSLSSGAWQVIYAALLLIAILILAAILYWVIRRMLARGTILSGDPAQRGKRSRLAVIDSFEVDRQRRLVLLRRDNVEHLVMIGGPNDVLIEPTIRRVAAQPPKGAVAPAPAQPVPSGPPMAQQRAQGPEAAPLVPQRPVSAPAAYEPEQALSTQPAAQPNTAQRAAPPAPPAPQWTSPPRDEAGETVKPAPAGPEAAEPAAAARVRLPDADLAAMAHKLEEALRRPSAAPAGRAATSPPPAPEPAIAVRPAPSAPRPAPAPPKPAPSPPRPAPSPLSAASRPTEPPANLLASNQVSRVPGPGPNPPASAVPARAAEPSPKPAPPPPPPRPEPSSLPPRSESSPPPLRSEPNPPLSPVRPEPNPPLPPARPEPSPTPPRQAQPQPQTAAPTPAPKTEQPGGDLESLEAEMAKLLGRPPKPGG